MRFVWYIFWLQDVCIIKMSSRPHRIEIISAKHPNSGFGIPLGQGSIVENSLEKDSSVEDLFVESSFVDDSANDTSSILLGRILLLRIFLLRILL